MAAVLNLQLQLSVVVNQERGLINIIPSFVGKVGGEIMLLLCVLRESK